MASPEFGEQIRKQIADNETSSEPAHYGGKFNVVNNKGTSQVAILAPNGDAISITSSINK